MKERAERVKLGVIGHEGRFGSRVYDVLQQALAGSEWMQLIGVDSKRDANPVQAAKAFDILVMSTAIETVEPTNASYAEALAEDGIERVYININSVQESARRAITQSIASEAAATLVVNVHPYFDPQAALEGAKLIFSGVDFAGKTDDKLDVVAAADNCRQLLEHLATTLPRLSGKTEAQPMRIIDLSTKQFASPTGETLTGTRLHDYIAAYTQAPYHMLRLRLREQPELVKQLGLPDLDLAGVRTSLSLAEAVVAQNEFAQALAVLPKDDLTPVHLQSWLDPIKREYQRLVQTDPEFDFVTANVKNIFAWADQIPAAA